jgi:hypothetical protein
VFVPATSAGSRRAGNLIAIAAVGVKHDPRPIEAERLRDEALKRWLSTPPESHGQMVKRKHSKGDRAGTEGGVSSVDLYAQSKWLIENHKKSHKIKGLTSLI